MRRLIKFLILSCALCSTQMLNAWAEEIGHTCQAETAAVNHLGPIELYGVESLSYDIFRNGSKVGSHQVDFIKYTESLIMIGQSAYFFRPLRYFLRPLKPFVRERCRLCNGNDEVG